MKVLKYTTDNLECYNHIDINGIDNYQIFEKGNKEPIVIYINEDDIRLAETLPLNIEDYKYFNELCDIIGFLKWGHESE